jgi:hypothetical protein
MRSFVTRVLLLGSFLFAAGSARADDDVKAILDKAIKAHGGAEKIDKRQASQTKSKGTLEIMGLTIPFTEQTSSQADRLKSVLELEVMGQTITQTTVYNGEKGWIAAQGKTQELEGKTLDELKEAAYLARASRFTALKDKPYELSSLGELKVNGKPAVGIKVASKGHRDVSLFFDKETGLLAKMERQGFNPMTEKEFNEERIITEYQEVDGAKVPKKAVINRDGKKFIEVEIVESKSRDKFDESEFAKP